MIDSKDIEICVRLKNDFLVLQKDIEKSHTNIGIYFIDSENRL